MTLTSMKQAESYLARFYDNHRTPYNLDNMRALMRFLDQPQDKFKAVHVAGTSGKSSTAYYMSALLTAAGKKTGLTVSPHIDSLTERVQINGQSLSEAEFCQALSEFLTIIEPSGIQPSWFEAVVSFAFWYFAREKVEYAAVEVGLGGLLDGTNVMSRPDKLCLLTDIGLDHTEILGMRLTDIAGQKIGIVQPGNLALTLPQADEIMAVYRAWCQQHKAKLQVIELVEQTDATLPAYQNRNWSLAREGYLHLEKRDKLRHLTRQELAAARHITVPGRMDIQKRGDKTIIMDGAHNQPKLAAFWDSFGQLYPETKPAVLLALKNGKEYEQIIPLLQPIASKVIVTGFAATQDIPLHSMDPQVLASALRQAGIKTEIIENPLEAYRALLKSDESVLVVTGSFYLLGQIRNN